MGATFMITVERMVCEAGHPLEWRGRWIHLAGAPISWCALTATYPFKYYKEGARP